LAFFAITHILCLYTVVTIVISSLQQLLQRPDVWRNRDRRLLTSNARGYATGFITLDHELHGGGWPRGALTELLLAQPGIGELQLLLPLLADLSRRQLLQVWINPPFIPYAPALQQHGITIESILIVRSEPQHLLWACEQALRSAACGAVLYWPMRQIRYAELRKLQVAAAAQNVVGFLFRDTNGAAHTSPAQLRLQLTAITAPHDSHLSIRILKQRGGVSGQQVLLPRDLSTKNISSASLPYPSTKISNYVETTARPFSLFAISDPATIARSAAALRAAVATTALQ
jgi:hypothetical protein